MIAGLQRCENGRRHRSHAGGGSSRGLGALELDHAPLEHRDVGIGKARVEETAFLSLESLLALFGAVVNIALRQEQGLGCFAKLRAQRAGMDQPGFGAVAGSW